MTKKRLVRSTTVLAVRRDGKVVLAGDGQVTMGEAVIKHTARKIRRLYQDKILAGFAGSTADAFSLFSRFESKLEQYHGNLGRAAVELAKDWRTDKFLRHLEALLLVCDRDQTFLLSGQGDVIEPDGGIGANLDDAREFAEAIHSEFPDKMLAYNLSPSFSWDTTGMSEEEMRSFPEELGKLGFVFNFITYGGHQLDGLAAEEFTMALKQDGMLALARLQRKLRMVDSPYGTPQTLVGGPRADAALAATSGRTATTMAMGKGSTQHQHLIQTEVPKKLLEEWLAMWTRHYKLPGRLRVQMRPQRAGSELLELGVYDEGEEKLANVIFAPIHDRRGRSILSVRDQNTFAESLRKKRLMTLVHLFLVHRFKAASVHYVTPTEDNQYQVAKMRSHGIFSEVNTEVGQIIVAHVNHQRISEFLAPDQEALRRLIRKER